MPIVPRGAGSGLSGGAAGIDGALTIAFTAMDRILEIDRPNLVAVVQPGVINAATQGSRRRGRAVLPARPRQLRDVHDRGQPRHQRRRAVLRQVRPDARFGPVARSRDGRRHGHPDRRPQRQGRGRLLADPSHRGQPGHARDHHRGDAPAPPGATAALHDAGLLPDPRERRRRGGRDRRGRTVAGHPRAARSVHHRGGRRRCTSSGSTGPRRRC